jgi:hypothetical protein
MAIMMPAVPVSSQSLANLGIFTSARAKLALLGDSRCQLSHFTNTTSNAVTTNGYALGFHIQQQCAGRVEVPQRLNFGVGGISTADLNSVAWSTIVANTVPSGTQAYAGNQPQPAATWPTLTPLESCARSDADLVLYLCSTNDRTAGLTVAQTQANITTALNRLRAAGKKVIILAEMPRGDTTYTTKRLTSPQLDYHLRVAQWVRNLRMPGVYVVDPWPVMALATSTTGDAIVGATYDGLHPCFASAYQVGTLVANTVASLVQPFNGILPCSNSDVWSANNPSGSLVSNPMLANPSVTPAASSGVTISGLLPANWVHQCNNMSGLTLAYGTTTLNGVSYLTVTLSGTPTVASPRLDVSCTLTAAQIAGIAAGDVVQTMGVGYMQAGSTGLATATLNQYLWNATNTAYMAAVVSGYSITSPSSSFSTVYGGTTGQWGGLFETEKATYDGSGLGSSTQAQWRLYMTQNVAVNATFLIGPTAMRKVV